ncbi:hypothetical protein [Luteibacter sp.]|jgi:hypothetical protein|uniref:hypothetical protein n=1 Tax=Luteibacter sp. TaxID=1886636 RepID=UPI002F3E244B
MPLTAYSRRFAAELDLEQWLSRVIRTDSIDDRLRGEAAADLECPSCAARGAILVSAGVSKRTQRRVRQGTFRFVASNGGDAHHPLCDFAGLDDSASGSAALVDFQSPKDWLTRDIRRLVCAGLQVGAFTQVDMRAMRLWFLEARKASQTTLTLDPHVPRILSDVWKWHGMVSRVPFAPSHGDIPGFNWRAAARADVLAPFHPVIEAIIKRRQWPREDIASAASSLLKKSRGVATFDASVLSEQFDQAERLIDFMISNYALLEFSRRRRGSKVDMARQPPCYALASLLLFVSDWDLSAAADRFTRLAAVSEVDELAGNLIGLNPFSDLLPIGLIKLLQEHEPAIDPSFDLKATVDAQEATLKASYQSWVDAGRPEHR